MIAENLLREPDNPKFRQFKPTNTIIKRDLVDPKGALEYAVAVRLALSVRLSLFPLLTHDISMQMGFCPEVLPCVLH
jgi:hypothetical protein